MALTTVTVQGTLQSGSETPVVGATVTWTLVYALVDPATGDQVLPAPVSATTAADGTWSVGLPCSPSAPTAYTLEITGGGLSYVRPAVYALSPLVSPVYLTAMVPSVAGAPVTLLVGAQGVTGPEGPAAWKPVVTYSATTAYGPGPPADVVTYGGSTWVALASSTAVTPGTNGAVWAQLAAEGATGAIGPAGPEGPIGLTGATGAAGPVYTPPAPVLAGGTASGPAMGTAPPGLGGTQYDTFGTVGFGSGTSPSAGELVTIYFNTVRADTLFAVMASPMNALTVPLGVYCMSWSTTGLTFGVATPPAASQPGNTYLFAYIISPYL